MNIVLAVLGVVLLESVVLVLLAAGVWFLKGAMERLGEDARDHLGWATLFALILGVFGATVEGFLFGVLAQVLVDSQLLWVPLPLAWALYGSGFTLILSSIVFLKALLFPPNYVHATA